MLTANPAASAACSNAVSVAVGPNNAEFSATTPMTSEVPVTRVRAAWFGR